MDYQELKLLEDDLWEAADQLRANSKLTASEYSMPVLGLIFLRHATTRFHALLPEVEKAVPARATGALREERIKLGFQGKAAIYLPETARYDHLAALPAGTNVGEAIRDAMIAIEDSVADQKGQKLLEGALPKDYLGLEQDLLAELLKIFNRPALQTATGDVFGRIYEYFLNQFAQSGAQEGGEFFTPPNHQYIGVNKAIAKLQSGDADVLAGKLGVFWHTQGSGKSYSMVFFCQKVHRRVSSAYTFVLLTDRKELDDQIYTTFVGCGVSTNKGDKATGADGLERLLKDQNRRYVFSLIHKFRKRVSEPWTTRKDIIVLSDEAHRTQYGRLATQMRMALRHAGFLAFTGTPLIDSKERHETEKVFGAYVSVYDFQRAVADGATLPLYYENRGEKLRLVDPYLNKRIEERIDAARADGELSEEQEAKLYRELAREYPVFTSDTHLNDVATDFVEHYHQRWRLMEAPTRPGEVIKYGGNAKALLVCIDKAIRLVGH